MRTTTMLIAATPAMLTTSAVAAAMIDRTPNLDPAQALLLFAMAVLGVFSLGGGLILLLGAFLLRSTTKRDPNFKEPRNEC